MLERTSGMILDAVSTVSVAAGSTRFFHEPEPDTGSTFKFTANTRMSMMATQNPGIAWPSAAKPFTSKSNGVLRKCAAATPSTMPTSTDATSDTPASCSEYGMRSSTRLRAS